MSGYFALIDEPLRQVKGRLKQCLTTPYRSINQQLLTIGAGEGKMLRPALVLLTGLACGPIRPEHIELAAIVEMIHTATLLHDDVIDHASVRRSRPTTNCLYGNTAAVLLGDFLLSRAFELGMELKIPAVQEILTQTARQICQGELLQNIRRRDWTIRQREYLEIIEAKTAELFSAACRLGALAGAASAGIADCFTEYGRCVGMAFQITDDILDITGDAEKIGKTLGTDAAQKKPTLPLIYCLKQMPPRQKKTFLETISREPNSARLVRILNESGSLDYARDTARQYIRKAVDALRECQACPAVETMIKIASAIGKRA